MLIFPSGSPLVSRMVLLATVYVSGKFLWSISCPPGSLAFPAITIISGSNLTVANACIFEDQVSFHSHPSKCKVVILTEDSWDEKKKRAFTEVEWLKWSRPCSGIDTLCPGQALNCMSQLHNCNYQPDVSYHIAGNFGEVFNLVIKFGEFFEGHQI